MDYKQKAETYVRAQLPELMELSVGCVIENAHGINCKVVSCFQGHVTTDLFAGLDKDDIHRNGYKIIGHPIQLHHWFRVLINGAETVAIDAGNNYIAIIVGEGMNEFANKITFNLPTAQPATEADYQAFCKIVGI